MRRGPATHCYICTSLLLKAHKQRIIAVTSFRLSISLYSPSVMFKRTNDLFFCISRSFRSWNLGYQIPASRHLRFFIYILYISTHFKSFFDAQNLLSVNIAMYHSTNLLLTAEVEKYGEALRAK